MIAEEKANAILARAYAAIDSAKSAQDMLDAMFECGRETERAMIADKLRQAPPCFKPSVPLLADAIESGEFTKPKGSTVAGN